MMYGAHVWITQGAFTLLRRRGDDWDVPGGSTATMANSATVAAEEVMKDIGAEVRTGDTAAPFYEPERTLNVWTGRLKSPPDYLVTAWFPMVEVAGGQIPVTPVVKEAAIAWTATIASTVHELSEDLAPWLRLTVMEAFKEENVDAFVRFITMDIASALMSDEITWKSLDFPNE